MILIQNYKYSSKSILSTDKKSKINIYFNIFLYILILVYNI